MKININQIFFVASILFIFSCGNKSKTEQTFEVEYKGSLKDIMRKGDLSAKAELSEHKDVENIYALGAIENLKGEIQIFNSQPINSYVKHGIIKFDSTYLKSATLFVKSVVKEWISLQIPDKINSKIDLEKFIEKAAAENKININRPFPFLIEG
jgi:acetolactate decarboxylase